MEERIVPLVEVKAMLEKSEAERGELTYEQKLALEHAKRFSRFDLDGLKKLLDELKANPKVDHTTAIRIADVVPTHPDDVRAIFSKARVNLDEAEVQKILETVAKYRTA